MHMHLLFAILLFSTPLKISDAITSCKLGYRRTMEQAILGLLRRHGIVGIGLEPTVSLKGPVNSVGTGCRRVRECVFSVVA